MKKPLDEIVEAVNIRFYGNARIDVKVINKHTHLVVQFERREFIADFKIEAFVTDEKELFNQIRRRIALILMP